MPLESSTIDEAQRCESFVIGTVGCVGSQTANVYAPPFTRRARAFMNHHHLFFGPDLCPHALLGGPEEASRPHRVIAFTMQREGEILDPAG